MKKGALFIISAVIISCISSACNQSKSLQELLQEEQKAIDKFILMNGFKILQGNEYPVNGVFKENEYYKTSDGLFFQVVDSGNGKRVRPANDISVRYDYFQDIKTAVSGDSTASIYPFAYPYHNGAQPFSFVYGISSTYMIPYSPVCQGWVIPLSYVGENAVINMIVPSSIGSYNDNSAITPIFYKNLRYTKFN